MSAVGKESTVENIEEVSDGEGNGVRKVAGLHNGLYETSKVNVVPALQAQSQLGAGERRRLISEFSRDLEAFVAPLEAHIRQSQRFRARKFKAKIKVQARVADLVLEIVRQVAHRETGVFSIDVPIAQFLSLLCAGAVEAGVVTGLVRRAQKALSKRDSVERERARFDDKVSTKQRGLSYDISRELDELEMFVKWYVRRKMSLARLEISERESTSWMSVSGDGVRDEEDVVFGLEVMHDHQMFGVKGCLLACGIRLVGRDGQSLWLRVAVAQNGKAIPVKPEWQSWSDPVYGGDMEVLPATTPFCSLVPIRPHAQRLVIDEIRAFVPYAALDMRDGRQDVDITLSILDDDGKSIVELSRQESLCIPSAVSAGASVASPHSLGMWPHDVVSGDQISEFVVTSAYKMVAGWERNSITVSFDLSLFMHAGESVTLECRFVNEKGEAVELSSLGIPYVASELNVAVESVSSYRYRRVLNPKSAWAMYQGLCIDVPVEFLQLAAGTHEITCELVIVAEDERILCGDMGLVNVTVPLAEDNDGLEEGPPKDWDRHQLELESIEIDPVWEYGNDDSIRVQATFCPQNASHQIAELAAGRVGELFSPYRVLLSLEREDGHVLLQAFTDPLGMSFKPVTRAVCVEGHSEGAEHSVVANFSKQEVLGWSFSSESNRVGSKVRLFCRVTALTARGRVITSERKEFFVKIPSVGGKGVVKINDSVASISDVVARTSVEGDRLSIRALVNVPANDGFEDSLSLVFALSGADEEERVLGEKRLPLHHDGLWTRQQMGMTQIPIEFYTVVATEERSENSAVRVSLISSVAGELEIVQQSIKATGVLTEADGIESTEGSIFADEAEESQKTFGALSESKTLWKRLFR